MVGVGSSGKILVVDGNRASRDWIAALLNTSGYKVVATATAEEALAWAIDVEFDLAIIDCAAPFSQRLDLLRRLRWRCPKIRALFLAEQPAQAAESWSAVAEKLLSGITTMQELDSLAHHLGANGRRSHVGSSFSV